MYGSIYWEMNFLWLGFVFNKVWWLVIRDFEKNLVVDDICGDDVYLFGFVLFCCFLFYKFVGNVFLVGICGLFFFVYCKLFV